MALSPELLALAAQWSPEQRASVASSLVGKPITTQTPEPEIAAQAAKALTHARQNAQAMRRARMPRADAAYTAIELGDTEGLAHAVMVRLGHVPTYDESGAVLVWTSDTKQSRKPPKRRNTRKLADTGSATLARDGRPYDGTNARTADGGVSQHYKPGASASYGSRVTERRRTEARTEARTFTVTFSVVFTVKPCVLATYVDSWSADRTAAREVAEREFARKITYYRGSPWQIDVIESGSEAVVVPATDGARTPISGIGVSREPGRPSSVTADPYGCDYAAFRVAALAALRMAGIMAGQDGNGTRAGEWLADVRKWADRWAGKKRGQRWAVAALLMSEVTDAITGTDSAGLADMAAALQSPDMAWTLPA